MNLENLRGELQNLGLGLEAKEMEDLVEQFKKPLEKDLDLLRNQLKNGQVQQLFNLNMDNLKRGGEGGFERSMFRDNKGSITLETLEDGKLLTAKDAAGNLLFQGPYNTEDDKLAVPEDIQERFKQFNKNRFSFKIR